MINVQTTKVKHYSNKGFTLVEVIVAISVFFLAVSIAFIVLVQGMSIKQVGKGYMGAVYLADNFMSERKLRKDGVTFFFTADEVALIKDGRAGDIQQTERMPQVLVLSNDRIRYEVSCTAQVLSAIPFVYRGILDCRWQNNIKGNLRKSKYSIATVFQYQGGRREAAKTTVP